MLWPKAKFWQRTSAVWPGLMKGPRKILCPKFNLSWTDTFLLLGIYFHADVEKMTELNYKCNGYSISNGVYRRGLSWDQAFQINTVVFFVMWPLFYSQNILLNMTYMFLVWHISGQMLFCNGKPCKHVKTPKDYLMRLFYIFVPYFQPF